MGWIDNAWWRETGKDRYTLKEGDGRERNKEIERETERESLI